jgi:hypothetical protein
MRESVVVHLLREQNFGLERVRISIKNETGFFYVFFSQYFSIFSRTELIRKIKADLIFFRGNSFELFGKEQTMRKKTYLTKNTKGGGSGLAFTSLYKFSTSLSSICAFQFQSPRKKKLQKILIESTQKLDFFSVILSELPEQTIVRIVIMKDLEIDASSNLTKKSALVFYIIIIFLFKNL